LSGLNAGTYTVRQDLPFGWRGSPTAAAREVKDYPPEVDKGIAHIIGGSDAADMAYPFMASIGRLFNDDYFHSCGAALISDRFLLTAAHCSEDSEPGEVAVMLGTNDPKEGGHQLSVRSITLHPEWGDRISDGHDMALWELTDRVDLEGLGLYTIDMLAGETQGLAAPTTLATTIGWGVSDSESERLQEVHVPIASEESCSISYPQVDTFATQICAGAIDGGLDSCQGDSGGPLIVRDEENQRWMHAGITSWGSGCALAGKPGLYGRTSAMSTWAKSQIREESPGYQVMLTNRNVNLAFPQQATTRPLVAQAAPRWAISNMTLPAVEDGAIEANKSFSARFFLFKETLESQQEFDCEVDLDGEGLIAPTGSSCQSGTNEVLLSGYPDGAYQLTISATSAGKTRSRSEVIIAGTLEETEVQGGLSIIDDSDADYPGTYYIDYYEVTAAEAGVLSLVEVEAGFSLQIGLYDGDVRTAVDGGGVLMLASGGGSASFNFLPETGKRYLIGVSSQGSKVTGSYTLRLRNNGAPMATGL
jgi:secreted trypsin-like serine protease